MKKKLREFWKLVPVCNKHGIQFTIGEVAFTLEIILHEFFKATDCWRYND